jgi:colanic acid/amylovoran biosynthesis glycosyltransferase
MSRTLSNGNKVLVVVPQFPAINQPWIDTYLEQLLKNKFEFIVFSRNEASSVYSKIVDDFGLTRCVFSFSMLRNFCAKSLLKNIVDLKIFRSWTEIWSAINRPDSGNSFSSLFNIQPFVTTFHGLPPYGVGQFSAEKIKILYQNVAVVFVNTQFAKDQVCSLDCNGTKVQIMPQGFPIDNSPFVPKALPESCEIL